MATFRKSLTFALAALLLAVAGPAASAQSGRFVALGDSFASGAGVAPADPVAPAGCSQSAVDTAHLVASDLGYANFADRSCSGATTFHLANEQYLGNGTNPPQADSLNGSETLVTVSLGGNDAGYGAVTGTCLTYNASSVVPTATPCRNAFVDNGTDLLAAKAAAIADDVKAGLELIRARAPFAEIYAVGYGQMIPADAAGCPGAVGVSPTDAQLFDNWWRTTNATVKFEAQLVGAKFVDTYTPSIGHSACSGPSNRWIAPLINPAGALAMHPNANGLRANANAVELAIANKQIAAAAEGVTSGSNNPFTLLNIAADRVQLKIRRARLHAASAGEAVTATGSGAKFTLTAPHAGKVSFAFSKLLGKKQKRFGQPLLAKVELGVNNFRLTGRFAGRALKPGRYVLKAQFVEAGAAAPTAISFRILP